MPSVLCSLPHRAVEAVRAAGATSPDEGLRDGKTIFGHDPSCRSRSNGARLWSQTQPQHFGFPGPLRLVLRTQPRCDRHLDRSHHFL